MRRIAISLPMKRLFGLTLASILLSGCASLHMRPDDSIGVMVAKGIARVPVGILTLGLSERWHAQERTMESWLGSREADLLLAWGPPTAVSSDGSGGKLIVYMEQRVYVTPGYANTTTTGSATGYGFGNTTQVYGQAQSVTTYTPPQINQWQVFRQFRVDSRGIITAYSWRGL